MKNNYKALIEFMNGYVGSEESSVVIDEMMITCEDTQEKTELEKENERLLKIAKHFCTRTMQESLKVKKLQQKLEEKDLEIARLNIELAVATGKLDKVKNYMRLLLGEEL